MAFENLNLCSDYKTIFKIKYKSNKEIVALLIKYKKEENEETKQFIREEVFNGVLKYLVKMASKYSKQSNVDINDLINAGSIGLMKAIDDFAPEKNKGFLTYATYLIHHEVCKELRKNNIVYIPYRHFKKDYKNKIDLLPALNSSILSLDMKVKETEDGSSSKLKDTIEDIKTKNVEEAHVIEKQREVLLHVINTKLSPKQRFVIKNRYFDDNKKTYEEISKEISCSRQNIDFLEIRALEKLKEYISEKIEFNEPILKQKRRIHFIKTKDGIEKLQYAKSVLDVFYRKKIDEKNIENFIKI